MDFFRAQFERSVDTKALDKLKKEYQGSEEEKEDVLKAYRTAKGDLDGVYESVMFSNVLEDDTRIRGYIDAAITSEEVESYKAYAEESAVRKERRVKKARKEAKEAEKLKEKIDNKKKSGGSKKKGGDDGMGDLAALIQQRQQARGATFLDDLEAKYGGGNKKKRQAMDEPSEEAFAKNAKRKTTKGK